MEYLILVNDMEFGSFATLPYKNKGEKTLMVKVQCIVALFIVSWMDTDKTRADTTTHRNETS